MYLVLEMEISCGGNSKIRMSILSQMKTTFSQESQFSSKNRWMGRSHTERLESMVARDQVSLGKNTLQSTYPVKSEPVTQCLLFVCFLLCMFAFISKA